MQALTGLSGLSGVIEATIIDVPPDLLLTQDQNFYLAFEDDEAIELEAGA